MRSVNQNPTAGGPGFEAWSQGCLLLPGTFGSSLDTTDRFPPLHLASLLRSSLCTEGNSLLSVSERRDNAARQTTPKPRHLGCRHPPHRQACWASADGTSGQQSWFQARAGPCMFHAQCTAMFNEWPLGKGTFICHLCPLPWCHKAHCG